MASVCCVSICFCLFVKNNLL
uniref:Uncharacterized protein n=1 Tax=Arundo donax TaxID=35708 RepID=A0A0A8ZDK7_ARUDO